MTKETDTQMYSTHTLPQYVLKHFGGLAQMKMTKLQDGVWKFMGGGSEVVLNADTADEARQRIKEIVLEIDQRAAMDGRTRPHKTRLN